MEVRVGQTVEEPGFGGSSQLIEVGALIGARVPIEVALAEFGNLGMHRSEHIVKIRTG